MSEARDRLIDRGRTVSTCKLHGPMPWCSCKVGEFIDGLVADPADLITVVIETLTCETCQDGLVTDGEQDYNGEIAWDDCPHCSAMGLDPVKVQAVLRQFADAGVLTRVTHRHPNWHIERYGREVSTPTFDERFVSPWVPLGALE